MHALYGIGLRVRASWECDYVHIVCNETTGMHFMGMGLCACNLWEWIMCIHLKGMELHVLHGNGTKHMYFFYDVITVRILTKSSNPSSVPTISLSDFMMM